MKKNPEALDVRLRRRCATWLMQRRVDRFEATSLLGMTVDMLERVCGRRHLDHMLGATEAFERSEAAICAVSVKRHEKEPAK